MPVCLIRHLPTGKWRASRRRAQLARSLMADVRKMVVEVLREGVGLQFRINQVTADMLAFSPKALNQADLEVGLVINKRDTVTLGQWVGVRNRLRVVVLRWLRERAAERDAAGVRSADINIMVGGHQIGCTFDTASGTVLGSWGGPGED